MRFKNKARFGVLNQNNFDYFRKNKYSTLFKHVYKGNIEKYLNEDAKFIYKVMIIIKLHIYFSITYFCWKNNNYN